MDGYRPQIDRYFMAEPMDRKAAAAIHLAEALAQGDSSADDPERGQTYAIIAVAWALLDIGDQLNALFHFLEQQAASRRTAGSAG